ncbi:nitrite reductase small subunit NirD [Marinobacter caseinilyticus]|uniref:nitrite reductase small subunit NirD n=1 Tax=Marinobacter caseinilyticus TaxID=2692195 RepID=UPI00140D2887|nr:nitrite reductase small subunit NirD [Marinobacter caseinilyticus]
MSQQKQWQTVCETADLVANSGIAVWTPAGPVAVFYCPDETPSLYAIGHFDPIGNANVLARGIVGDIKGEPVVASPLYKQHYSLLSGQCLEDASVKVPTYAVQLDGDQVQVAVHAGQREECAA